MNFEKLQLFIEFPCIWASDLKFVEWTQSHFSLKYIRPFIVPATLLPGADAPVTLPQPRLHPFHTVYVSLYQQCVLRKYDELSM